MAGFGVKTLTFYGARLLCKLLYGLSGLFPRQAGKVCVGAYQNRFTDNSKYLYLHLSMLQQLKVIWITGDSELAARLNEQGLHAAERWSLKGIWHALTAGTYLYSAYVGDINQWLGKGARRINLWHGSPMKAIEFDITTGPMAERFQPPYGLLKRLKYHQEYLRPDLMLAPSEPVRACFASAFRLAESDIKLAAYPRSAFYQRYPTAKPARPASWRPRLILYAPSWRDGGTKHGLDTLLPAATLAPILERLNATLLLRLHPNDVKKGIKLPSHPQIVDISSREDVYDLLPELSLLISDYSSLYIDALLFDVPLAFYRFDEAEYRQCCRNAYHFADALEPPGPVVHTPDELIALLQQQDCLTRASSAELRHHHRQLYWQEPLADPFAIIETELGLTTAENQPEVGCSHPSDSLS
ncbi:CDP-glycerol glycerophosphotransferase family protein [Shewanella sp. 3B26]|uniref:CDP-glycerol glycerophosphotransferase family protein n=1 Tax=Shewanella zhuhaiensis TaxID=2919576 RepID=A0AAJ1BFN1_9GAMM|nr:CDP-glycerol glycerophosphotransferase family protein [Shewanella zhuhaiensis]MCH4293905.1 CDP-glycerol glycerophosphotransferase family protein [Shewanella zhuhaiensis]